MENDEYVIVRPEDADFEPLHPGIVLRLALKAKSLTADDFAEHCGLPVQQAQLILKGRADLEGETIGKASYLIGEAARSVTGSKIVHDYYKRHGQRPTSAKFALLLGKTL